MEENRDICLFCDNEIEEEEKIECKGCKSVYHKTCFEELHHICMQCGLDNSVENQNIQENNSIEDEPLENNIIKDTIDDSSIKEDAIEKQKKITHDNSDEKYCVRCGELITKGQQYCGKCGTKINNQENNKLKFKKKYFIGIIAIIIIIISAVLINNSVQKEKQQEARINYLKSVKEFELDLLIAGMNLEDIADTTQKYWYENIYEDKHGSNIDEAISNAISDKSYQISRAEEQNEEIKESYITLKEIPKGSEDLSDLLDIINNVYNSYTDFYNLAIYPEGNYNEYSENNNEKTNDFLDTYRKLSNYIDTDKEFNALESESDTDTESDNE